MDDHGVPDDTDAGIAYAAEAAAEAVEAADAVADAQHQQQQHEGVVVDDGESHHHLHQQQQLLCRICGRGDEEGRPVLRFLPVEHDVAAATAAPSVITFTEDIALHIFCGKTASILPSVNQPDLEILTKAGLKNKHGIGPEVNAALARTRCAILQQEGAKEKHFYLVREFEAHLAAIRHTHIPPTYIPDPATDPFPSHQDLSQVEVTPQYALEVDQPALVDSLEQPKVTPIKAAAGQIHKPGRRYEETIPYNPGGMTEDGKVRCGCGGTHLPTGTPRGAASWRNHVMTKRHQKWMEDNGLLGAV